MNNNLHSRREVREKKATQESPRTLAEFRAVMRMKRNLNNRRSAESEEEEELFYSSPSGYPGERFFRSLCPESPFKARIRIERIYWDAWGSAVRSILFSGFGIILLILGLVCVLILHEISRGAVILFAGVLLCTPGFYSLYVLLMYVRGHKNYSYCQLPGNH
ncbi:unnamed protein product [Phytomonas sp. EM1]|nr:unnamed protein product [Phytomonas sp. EM1]|eukprot:CCW61568.1 unnamed protein product [Phytomonas sp. isolate EM1]